MSLLKKPIAKNLCLSFTGNESVLNDNIGSFNNFPIGLMILAKSDPISERLVYESCINREESEELETELKLNYINQHAKDLFELKESDNSSKINEQLRQFISADNSEENLFSLLSNQKDQTEYYGAFKNHATLIWIKLITKKDLIYICSDYFSDDRKFVQNELFQSIKFQYIATLFHELYNPMNCILIMMEHNKYDDDNKSNLDFPNYPSEIVGTHFSLITENELDKINYNLHLKDDNNNINSQNDVNNHEYIILQNKYEKCLKLEEYYRNNYNYMKERENDIRVLVNIIYVFLENLILYLRLNLGDGKNNKEDNTDNNKNKVICLSVNNSHLNDEENNKNKNNNNNNLNQGVKEFSTINKLEKQNSRSENNSKENNKINKDLTSQLYHDNYLNAGKNNKKLNLKVSFLKHLKKFIYLFKFKNINYFKDFSFLSNKYISTDESIFSDFISQLYSFLYNVVPKSHGFIISFNIVSENKIKLTFQKENYNTKTGYTHHKFKKKDSFILLGNHFKAANTVKTIEMTIEILQKLSKMLGITLKIMDYLEDTEEKYLTILMPFFIGKDLKEKETYIDSSEGSLDESIKDNLLFENTIKTLEKIDLNNFENDKLVKMREKTKKIIDNINAKINVKKKSKKRLSLFAEGKDKDKLLSNINNAMDNNINNNMNNNLNNNNNIINNNIENVNINININKNININNNYNNSGISSFISNNNYTDNKNPLIQFFHENNLTYPKHKTKNNKDYSIVEINNASKAYTEKYNNKNKFKTKNKLTLIHEKYSFKERLRSSGVEILSEEENKSITESENEIKIISSEENSEKNETNDNKEQNSLNAEADSENYFEIENDNEDISEEIIFNNNYNNINLKIGDDYLNICKNKGGTENKENKDNDLLLKNNNQNINLINSEPNKINPISKKKKNFLDVRNKSYNKTLSYNKDNNKNVLFIIPENDNDKKEKISPHPSCKLNNKYLTDFNACDCHDILLVDDDEFICKTFKNILKKFKLEADIATNGLECLNMIKEKIEKNCKCEKNKYKIIFMDITMPVMDGIEAAKNIQQKIDNKEIYDSIKIIFISAHANIDLSINISGIKCAVDYYAKPISAEKYKQVLDKYYYGNGNM